MNRSFLSRVFAALGGIQGRLTFITLAFALVPMTIMGALIFFQARQSIQDQIGQNLIEVVESVGTEVLRYMFERTGDVTVMAKSETLSDIANSPATKAAYLKLIKETYGAYSSIYVTYANGFIQASTDDTTGDLSNTPWYTKAVASGLNVSDIYYSNREQRLVLTIAAPVYDKDERFLGVVVANVDAQRLIELVAAVNIGQEGEIFLVNNVGQNVIDKEIEGIFDDLTDNPAVQNVLKGERGVLIGEDDDGVPSLLAHSPLDVGVLNWHGIAALPLDELNTSTDVLAGTFALLAVIAAAIITVTIFFIARAIVRPIQNLTTSATIISQGNLDTPITVQSSDEVGQLADSFRAMTNQVKDLVGSLESRVEARTRDLATTIEVGRLATSIYSEYELLPRLVEFIRAKFDLYYTQVYLLDEAKTFAILRAGSGEVGKQLLERQHRLNMAETSLVARAVQTRQPVIVADTEKNISHRKNLLLPDTRSEASVPLMIGQEVLGVLDLQASHPNTFNDENAPVFQALANQIASVLRATQAFDEAQVAVFQAEQANRRLSAETWQGYLDERMGREGVAYAYDLEAPKSVAVGEDNSTDLDTRDIQPITILGQEVGRIVIKDSPDMGGQWSDDQRILVKDVAARVSAILEQYRAFDETEAALQITRRQTQALTLLNELSKELNGAASESDVYQILVHRLPDIVNNDHIAFAYLQDEKIVPYIVVEGRGLVPIGVTFPVTSSNSGSAITENWTLNEADLGSSERLDGQYLAAQGYHSSLHVPLTLDDQVVAAIEIASKRPDAFDDNAENLMLQISLLLAGALQNRRFLDQINLRALELGLVAEVGAAVTQIRDQDELLFTVSNLTKAVFDLYHAHIYLVDSSGENLVLAAGAGEVGRIMRDQKRTIALSNTKSIVAHAGRERQPVIVNRVRQTPDFLPHPLLPETESELAVPMVIGDQLVGVLDVQDNHADRFNDQQAQVQETLANQIAVAIENARAFQRIESTQAELQQSQTLMADLAQFQSAILDNAEYSIISTTVDGTITSFNRSAEKMLGYMAEEMVNKTSPAILHDLNEVVARTEALNRELPEAIEPGFITFIAKAKLSGQADVNEWTYIRKDGTRFPVELAITAIYNLSGQVTGYLGIAADISARKEQERAIEYARQDAETLYQVSADINAASDDQSIIRAVAQHGIHPAARHVQLVTPLYDDNHKLTAFRIAVEWYDNEVMPGGMVLSLENLPMLADFPARDLWSIQDFQSDTPVVDSHSQRVMLNLNNRSLTALRLTIGDDYLGSILFFSDDPYLPSERVNNLLRSAAEQLSSAVLRLQLSQQTAARASELEAIAQVTAAATSILDLDELLSSVVELTKERFGLYHAHIYLMDESRDNLILSAGAGEPGRVMKARGHKIPIMQKHSLVARTAREGVPAISNDVMSDPDFLPNPLLPLTRSELALPMIVAEVLVGVLDLQSDQPSFFSEQDARVKASLSDLIAVAVQNAQAYREQVQTAERLREVDKLKSQFLANMSHELRTPLNAIIGYAEVLLDGLDGDLNDEATEDVEAIHSGGRHLLSIINDILDLAKIEAGQMFMHRGKADLLTAVKDGVNTCSIIANNKGVELVVDAEGEVPPIYADPLRTKQIIINLVNNAIKFTEKGSVTVRVRQQDDATMRIDVVDTGIGMTSTEMGGLFQQFHQVDGSPTRRAGGTGLGLVITKHLVNMHGGDVNVTSQKGAGSTFTFTMPIYSEALEQVGQPA